MNNHFHWENREESSYKWMLDGMMWVHKFLYMTMLNWETV